MRHATQVEQQPWTGRRFSKTRATLGFSRLRKTQGTLRTGAANWQPRPSILAALPRWARSATRLERRIEREKLVLAALPIHSLQIVEFAREHGRVTTSEAFKLTGASRNPLKQQLRALVERGY
jgi:Fic family protein